MKNEKLNRHDRRKTERHLGKCRLILTHKQTKKKVVVNYKFKTKPTIEEMLKSIKIDKKPVNKADYDYKVIKIKECK